MKTSIWIAIGTIIALGAGEVKAQDSLGMTLVERRYDCWIPTDLAICDRGSFMTLGDNGYIILDQHSNPANRVERGATIEPHRVAVLDDSILIMLDQLGDDSRIIVSSTDNPSNPIGQLELPYMRKEPWAFSDSLLVIGRHSNLEAHPYYPDLIEIITIRSDSDPEVLSTIDGFTRIERVALTRDRLFVDNADSTLRIFDISDPASPRELEPLEFESGIFALASTPEMLSFILGPNRQQENWGTLWLFNCSDPDNIALLWDDGIDVSDPGTCQINLHPPYLDMLYTSTSMGYPPTDYIHFGIDDSSRLQELWRAGRIWEYNARIVDVEYDGDNPIWAMSGWAGVAGGLAAFMPNRWGELELTSSYERPGIIGGLTFANPDTIAVFQSIIGGLPMLGDNIEVREVTPSVRLFDATQPGNPVESAELLLEHGGFQNEYMVISDDAAYYGGFYSAWAWYDLNDLESREAIGTIRRGNDYFGTRGLLKFGNYLYVRSDQTIKILDISDAISPEEVGEFDFRLGSDMLRDGNRLYCCGTSQIGIYNIDNPESPEEIGMFELPRDQFGQLPQLFGVEVENDILYFNAYQYDRNLRRNIYTFYIYDINEIENPQLLTEFEIPKYVWKCEVSNEFLAFNVRQSVAGESTSELRIYDVHDPSNPIETGYYRDDDHFGDVVFHGNYIYTADSDHFSIFNCSAAMGVNAPPVFHNPPELIEVSEEHRILFNLQANDLNGDSLELTASNLPEGSSFIDRGDGQGTFNWQTDFTSAGVYVPVFVVSDGELTDTARVNIRIMNINRLPDAFHLVTPPDLAGDHELQYQEDSSFRFKWTSSSDPDEDNLRYHIQLIGSTYGSDEVRFDSICVDVGPDTSCLIDGEQINELFSPGWELLWSIWALDGMDSIRSDEVFRFVHYSGVGDSSFTPYVFHLAPPYPNPFNSLTTITFSGGIPLSIEGGRGGLSLKIYDLSGRLVADLTHSAFRAPHSPFGRVVWDASRMGAGVYFVRLEAGEEVKTQKIVLMR